MKTFREWLNEVTYEFNISDRVYVVSNGRYATIVSMVPGDGRDPWYYVQYEDGGEDRWQASDLEKA